jgi:hypothetical protein
VPDPPQGLRPADPREWMRVWARVIARPSVKCVGFACAHFADYRDGSEIRPGNTVLGLACGGMDKKTVISALAQIREWGLIWRYLEGSKNGRAGKSDIYRLTFPDDISAIPMLSPDWEPPCGQPPEQVA